MDRPVMHTMLLDGVKPPPPKPSAWRHLLAPFRWALAVLTFDPFHRGPKLHVEDGSTLLGRMIRGLLYRSLLLPFALAVLVCSLVWVGTHPPRAGYATADPASVGVHFETVTYPGPDESTLEAWFVPLLDPRAVLEQGTGALRRNGPAVLLVHDDWANRMQMLPLVRPLHEAGFVVMVASVRGAAPSGGPTTFGLRESEDVLAALDALRRQKGVDAARIAVLGTGMGANAVRLAARHDPAVAAVVLDRPADDVDAIVADHLAPRDPRLAWVRPVCRMAFDIAYRQNLYDVAGEFHHNAVLVTGKGAAPSCFAAKGTEAARDFLLKAFGMDPLPPAAEQATTTDPQ